MLEEFKQFALKGSMLDMAVGIIIGAAFGTIVKSLVDDVIMPPIGLLMGGVDFANFFAVLKPGDPVGPYATIIEAQEAGAVTLNWGLFVNNVLAFLIVAIAVFFVVRSFNRLRRTEEVEEAPTGPTETELLTEIRDALRARG